MKNKIHIKLGLSCLVAIYSISSQAVNLKDYEYIKYSENLNSLPEMIKIEPIVSGVPILFEDFESQAMPAGWLLFNVDGLTPNGSVSQFTDAWIVAENFEVSGTYNMQSTSWYFPVGQADDWVVTSMVSLPAFPTLSWDAEAQDPAFPDGYEVYISTTTQDVAGCSANPPVFAVAAEASQFVHHELMLWTLGYANQDVYICYRNNSTDQFIIQIDNIEVGEVALNDLAITSVSTEKEYTLVPDVLINYRIPLAVEYINNGIADQSNFTIQAEIFKDGSSVHIASNTVAATLQPGATGLVDLGGYKPSANGDYSVTYTILLDSVPDGKPADNSVELTNIVNINTGTMSKDNNISTGSVGIGAGNGGYIGNAFEFVDPVTISSVEFVYDNNLCDPNPPNDCSMDGESIVVDVFAFDSITNLPAAMVGSSQAHVVPTGEATSIVANVVFDSNLNLSPGKYLFAVQEPVRTTSVYGTISLKLNASDTKFVPGTTWVDWPTNSNGQWTNSEDLGFNVAYLVRPKFVTTDLIFKNGFEY